MSPLVPAGTIAAFATTVAVGLLRVETTGWVSPAGHTDRYPSACREGLGTTVKLSEYAIGLRPDGMQLLSSKGKLRGVCAARRGPPRSASVPRVSTRRQGVRG